MILDESAIADSGQQELHYEESVDPVEILEAYTEKPDGRRIDVDAANILTRDEATGLDAVYERDAKVKTVIYSDVDVGDILWRRSRRYISEKSFPGQYFFDQVFLKFLPYADYRLIVDLPPGLDLNVRFSGEGIEEQTERGGRRLIFTYRPAEWTPAELGAVTFAENDPQIVLSTYKSFEELGAGYWANMKGKAVVTPEIQEIADTITAGISGKREQAEAIDRWVKKNIRYVLVTLGSGGFTPNPAPAILKNRYGDCKDHVILMGALLQAKGIASEPALINVGERYSLPALPVPAFNHVILYLPDFDLYDDPTGPTDTFGTLGASSYDKPVLRLSEGRGVLSRTPPMKPDQHVSEAKTVAFVAADGTVKGETRETATGVFASMSRSAVTDMQKVGKAKYAEELLRQLKRPGRGRFDAAIASDFSEPYTLHATFTLNDKLETPLSGLRDLPLGMPVHPEAAAWFFGQRLAGRKTDFFCYSGKLWDTIEVTFAEGLPLPKPLDAVNLDNAYFSYRQDSTVEGRTLKISREFTSRVKGQVCPSRVEEEIGPALQRMERSLKEQMTFGRTTTSELESRGPVR